MDGVIRVAVQLCIKAMGGIGIVFTRQRVVFFRMKQCGVML